MRTTAYPNNRYSDQKVANSEISSVNFNHGDTVDFTKCEQFINLKRVAICGITKEPRFLNADALLTLPVHELVVNTSNGMGLLDVFPQPERITHLTAALTAQNSWSLLPYVNVTHLTVHVLVTVKNWAFLVEQLRGHFNLEELCLKIYRGRNSFDMNEFMSLLNHLSLRKLTIEQGCSLSTPVQLHNFGQMVDIVHDEAVVEIYGERFSRRHLSGMNKFPVRNRTLRQGTLKSKSVYKLNNLYIIKVGQRLCTLSEEEKEVVNKSGLLDFLSGQKYNIEIIIDSFGDVDEVVEDEKEEDKKEDENIEGVNVDIVYNLIFKEDSY